MGKVGVGGQAGLAVVNVDVARIVGRGVIVVGRTEDEAGVALGVGSEGDIASITADYRPTADRDVEVHQIDRSGPLGSLIAEATDGCATDHGRRRGTKIIEINVGGIVVVKIVVDEAGLEGRAVDVFDVDRRQQVERLAGEGDELTVVAHGGLKAAQVGRECVFGPKVVIRHTLHRRIAAGIHAEDLGNGASGELGAEYVRNRW